MLKLCAFPAKLRGISKHLLTLLYLNVTRANCMRALGSLIQCFDSMASSGFAGGGRLALSFAIQSQRELQDLCQQVLSMLC